MNATLPQRPDVIVPEKKVSKWKVFAVIGAAVFGLAAIAGAVSQPQVVPVTVHPPTETVAPSPAPTMQEEMLDWYYANESEWLLTTQALKNTDLNGAVQHLNNVYPMPDPAADQMLEYFKEDLIKARDAFNDGDIATATVHVQNGSQWMTELAAYIKDLLA